MNRKQYIYVTFDPLLENVVCVHKKQDSTCNKCEKILRENRTSYHLYNNKFLIKN